MDAEREEDKRLFRQLQERINKLEERVTEEESADDGPSKYAILRKRTRTLRTVEQLQEEIRMKSYFVIEGMIADSLNKIDAADCSNNMQGGGKVRKVRLNARKVQAGVLQITSLLKNNMGDKEERT